MGEETGPGQENHQEHLETFEKRLSFFHDQVIVRKGEDLLDPEAHGRVYDMELFFGAELSQEDARLIKEKVGVDLSSEPEIKLVDEEGNVQMVGWKTENPDWTLLRWKREGGVQLLTYEETMLPDFAESLELEVSK